MPPRRDAETGNEAELAAPVTGNVDTDALLHDLAVTQELVIKQEELIKKMSARLDEVEKFADPGERPPPPVYEPPPLPEGTKRYASRYTEQTLMRVAYTTRLIEGLPIEVPVQGRPVEFQGGVFETDDEDVQAWLAQHPDYGITFWEDSTAVKRHGRVEVNEGVRGTGQVPTRAPMTAPMGE